MNIAKARLTANLKIVRAPNFGSGSNQTNRANKFYGLAIPRLKAAITAEVRKRCSWAGGSLTRSFGRMLLALQQQEDFQVLLQRYVIERLLYRVSLSEYSEQFLLNAS